jgi:hypothetical protein
MKMPEELEYCTADDVAECFEFHDPNNVIYGKLWSFVAEARNRTPMGGDESDGTVETPDGRLDLSNDDKTRHWWHRLTEEEQGSIVAGLEASNQ